jgi:glutamate-1-semialdehyde 2,1-aminomutase
MAGGLASSFAVAHEFGDAIWTTSSRTEGTLSPPVFVRGRGATLIDVDGREYVDYIGAGGSMILGHADDRVVAAISKAAAKGCGFGAPAELEVRLAELLVGRFIAINMVRLTSTPTEALCGATALALAYTGRPDIVAFDGHQGIGKLPGAILRTADGCAPSYTDVETVNSFFHESGSTIAAVVVEPICTSAGLVLPADRFLRRLRTLCDAHGALLVFDETVTGLRVAADGAGSLYDVKPDLTVLGSIVGGGLPFGAYGGPKEVMNTPGSDVTGDGTGVAQSPRFPPSGNLLGMAAGIATLQAVGEAGFYEALDTTAKRLHEGLQAAAAASGIRTQQTRIGSILGLMFSEDRIVGSLASRRIDTARFASFFGAMLDHNVLLPPSPLSCIFVSAAHTDEEIDRTIEAAHEAFRIAAE